MDQPPSYRTSTSFRQLSCHQHPGTFTTKRGVGTAARAKAASTFVVAWLTLLHYLSPLSPLRQKCLTYVILKLTAMRIGSFFIGSLGLGLPASLAKSVGGVAAKPPLPVKANPAKSFTKTVGNTRLVELSTITPREDVRILLKCEFQNPGLSIKDRIAEHILNEAEESGKIKAGGTVVTASSGNTAAAFAMLCSVRGYHCVAITNEKCSDEKVNALKAYDAEIMVTRSGVPPDHPEHYQQIEDRLVSENPSWFGVNQYDNPMNPEAYYKTIAPEIWEQTNGKITHFVAAASTGGTVSGIGRFLKERSNGAVRVICPDPVGSIFRDYWRSGGTPPTDSGSSFQVEGVGKVRQCH